MIFCKSTISSSSVKLTDECPAVSVRPPLNARPWPEPLPRPETPPANPTWIGAAFCRDLADDDGPRENGPEITTGAAALRLSESRPRPRPSKAPPRPRPRPLGALGPPVFLVSAAGTWPLAASVDDSVFALLAFTTGANLVYQPK